MRSFTICVNDENQRLDKFLTKAIPRLPKSLLYKSLRTKRIKVNGKKSEISYRLCAGDLVELYLNDEFFEQDSEQEFLLAPVDIKIVYEDNNILLVDKQPGLCVHEDNDHTVDTLINRVLHYLYNKGEYNPAQELSFTPALANRIDRNTGGIVLAAKNAEALRELNQKIKEREIRKFYLCVVDGIPRPESATLTAYLKRNENESAVEVYDQPGSDRRTIITRYQILKHSKRNSLLEVELKTGRTHQIRAHMAYIGHPLLGDGKYGIGRLNREYGLKQQLLYAYKLQFDCKDSGNLLDALNGKTFEIHDIWFQEEFDSRF